LRFTDNSVVVTAPQVLEPNDADDTTLSKDTFDEKDRKVTVSAKNHQIKINSFNAIISMVMAYDLRGRLLYKNDAVNKNEHYFAKKDFTKQIIIVVTVLSDGTKQTNKIIY
jgi:endo-1,4-beta-D-glucanase Y